MAETYWWSNYGPFKKWQACPTRPDPGEVLLFYLKKRGIEQSEYISYLMELLDLQKSMVYNILKGNGFDTISRSRQLVTALKIYPPLLGIDAKYYPIELHTGWWKKCGFAFTADDQGYPLVSEVVAYLRQQRTQTGTNGRVKIWTQEDLGDATGLRKEIIYRTEHDKNPLILESMSRRAIIASALGNVSAEIESTIYHLFGLDPQAYGVPVPAQECTPVLHLSHPLLSDEMLQERHQKLATLFMEYYTGHAQDRVGEILDGLRESQAFLARATTTAQRVACLAIGSRSHRLLACTAREQCQTGSILFHTNQAVKLAEQAMTLPHPKLSSDHIHLLTAHELLASACFTQALGYYEQGQDELAQEAIDRAVHLLPKLQSNHLKTEILGATAVIHAPLATCQIDRQTVLSCINRAVQTQMASQFQDQVADDNFFWCSKSMLYIYKAETLTSPHMKGMTAETVRDILEDAQRFSDPERIRRQVIIECLLAECHLAADDYQEATVVALGALEKSRHIRSRLWRKRIDGLYQRLLHTSFKGKPLLAYLGMKLRTWECGMA